MLSARRSSAAGQQGAAGPLSVGIDDQADDGAGACSMPGIDPQRRRSTAPAPIRVGNAHLPLRQAPWPGRYGRARSCRAATSISTRWPPRSAPTSIAPMVRTHGLRRRNSTCPSDTSATAPSPIRDWMMRKYHRKWQTYDTVNMSIGQGYVLINPLQLAVMAGRHRDGQARRAARSCASQASRAAAARRRRPSISPSSATRWAASSIRRGTAARRKLPIDGIQMAGKTGTAQVRRITWRERSAAASARTSAAWKLRDHSLFIGFVPADNPRYACAAIVEHGGFGARSPRRWSRHA